MFKTWMAKQIEQFSKGYKDNKDKILRFHHRINNK